MLTNEDTLQCDYYYGGHLKLENQITVGYEQ